MAPLRRCSSCWSGTIQKSARDHFEEALAKRDFGKNDVEAGRQFVNAYVEYIHCVEALYATATRPVEGHYDEADVVVSEKEQHGHEE